MSFRRTNRKTGSPVTLHHREMFKKTSSLDTYCNQTVIQEISEHAPMLGSVYTAYLVLFNIEQWIMSIKSRVLNR